ncbi:MAG: type VI secretion system baseplate subunit TssG [Gemmataceae bacterium]|nr:type VI secretion system baseplate subunit TssG [Gemmataceae bacterium]MCI0742441.1 type VI secretion system baseplate subunit TssG [Gemmataceae bacterium]
MATSSGGPPIALSGGASSPAPRGQRASERTLEEWLFQEGYVFDFFQAVRLLEQLDSGPHAPRGDGVLPEQHNSPTRSVGTTMPVGRSSAPDAEAVRFHARLALDFPPSAIHEIKRASPDLSIPAMTVSFLGLTGPSGVLPRHYTELMMQLERESRGREKLALRAWFDLFNHRFISLFYRSWDKYRFFLAFERGEYSRREPDTFTLGLLSLAGLGMPALRNRLHISARALSREGREASVTAQSAPFTSRPSLLGRIEDLSLLRYSGFFAHRPRNAVSLEAMLRAFLKLPVEVIQFQGQWLRLEATNCTALGGRQVNNAMGVNVIVGDRVWDVQSKVRIRLGPLTYAQFQAFLPDRSPTPRRKALFLLSQLVRLYVGPEMDVEFQLVLSKDEVPACALGARDSALGSRLGWNTWSRKKPKESDAQEAVFQADELVWTN